MTLVSQPPSLAIDARSLNLSLGEAGSRITILQEAALHIAQGEAVAILGPSGSGKSTLLMVLAGLETFDSGSLMVAGHDLGPMSEDQLAEFRRQTVGIVFQSFHLIPTMTAVENVAVPLELAGVKDAFPQAEAALARVGLKDRLHHYPSQLSGGEQQRVAIARAIAPKPKVLFADEPTGNLDAVNGAMVSDLLFDLQKDLGSTLVLVTHDPSLAARANRVFSMQNGQPVEQTKSEPHS